MAKDQLIKEAAALGITLDAAAVDKLFLYKDFLLKYNKKVNLTSIVDEQEFIVKHFLDSLTLLPELEIHANTRLIDVGTGAGFPGIVLKILRPEIDLVLLDSLNKRIKFLEQAIKLLALDNISCIHGRAEEISRKKDFHKIFDYATARAVAALPKLAEYCLPFVKPGGFFIAMKGRNYHEEAKEATAPLKRFSGKICEIKEITLPGDIGRCLVKIKKL